MALFEKWPNQRGLETFKAKNQSSVAYTIDVTIGELLVDKLAAKN